NAAEIVAWTGGGALLPTNFDDRGLAHIDVGKSTTMLERWWRDADLRRRAALSAHACWRESHTWEKLAGRYENLYLDLLKRRPAAEEEAG
ncbi:MAG: hypothetical protein D6751_00565, partial [Deltaproteobacteria bacterium]